MPDIRYMPASGDDDSVTVFGRHFEAGKPVSVDDEFAGKVRGNPTFEIKGEKSVVPSEDAGANEDAVERAVEDRQLRQAEADAEKRKKADRG